MDYEKEILRLREDYDDLMEELREARERIAEIENRQDQLPGAIGFVIDDDEEFDEDDLEY